MSVATVKKYLQDCGYLKRGLVEIAVAVEMMMLPMDPHFKRVNETHTMKQILNIHDIHIDDHVIKANFVNIPFITLPLIFGNFFNTSHLFIIKCYSVYELFGACNI